MTDRTTDHRSDTPITLRQLYPDATDGDLEKIEETLDRYIELLFDLVEGLEREPDRLARHEALTKRNEVSTVDDVVT